MLIRARSAWKPTCLRSVRAACLMLVPYAYLLSQRSHTMDDVQLLVRTHALDLTRVPELISFVVLAVIAAAVVMKCSRCATSDALAVSLASTPVTVVQPATHHRTIAAADPLSGFHRELRRGLAVVVTLAFFSAHRAIVRTAFDCGCGRCACRRVALWGFVECHYTVRVLDDVNVIRDEALPVARRLTELGKDDPNVHKRVVLHLGIAEADDMPTIAPQSVLWARHQHVFAGVTWEENKERYYQQLLYQGVRAEQLANGMKKAAILSR